MKSALISLLAFFSVSAAAAPVSTYVIDFESFSTGYFDTLQFEDGFVIDPALSRYNPAVFENTPIGTGNAIALCLHCGDGPEGFSIYRNDGNSFELDSLNIGYGYVAWGADITGHLAGGGTVNMVAADGLINFDSSWADLISVDITFTTPCCYTALDVAFVDNITMQAVPIPAALWLFGSALAGLGWLRRKGTIVDV